MNVKPGVLMMIGGGALMFIGSFLDWIGTGPFAVSGTETDFFGFQGILVLLMGAIIAIVVAIQAFAPQVNLPGEILGLSMNRVVVIFGLAGFLVCFPLMFTDFDPKVGVFLVWIGGALAVAGGIMETQSESPSTASTF